MAGKGPAPKPAHLRQRTNKKFGSAILTTPDGDAETPEIPNPDARVWHPLTLEAWEKAWSSEMASQWPESDRYVLGRLALIWDDFYKKPGVAVLAEIRLQEQRFGLSPLDRSRLQWEVGRADEAERKRPKPTQRTGADPRAILMAVK